MGITSFVRHTVDDYDAWLQSFDEFHESRGLDKPTVYRGAVNGNEITVVGQFDSLDEGQQFLTGPEVVGAMRAAGVQNPDIWFAEEITDESAKTSKAAPEPKKPETTVTPKPEETATSEAAKRK